MFAPIFRGLTVTAHNTYISKAVVTMDLFNTKLDQLSMRGNDYKHGIVATMPVYGRLEIINPGIVADNASFWNGAVNHIAYRLNTDVSILDSALVAFSNFFIASWFTYYS